MSLAVTHRDIEGTSAKADGALRCVDPIFFLSPTPRTKRIEPEEIRTDIVFGLLRLAVLSRSMVTEVFGSRTRLVPSPSWTWRGPVTRSAPKTAPPNTASSDTIASTRISMTRSGCDKAKKYGCKIGHGVDLDQLASAINVRQERKFNYRCPIVCEYLIA
jgi:hypothetical protein